METQIMSNPETLPRVSYRRRSGSELNQEVFNKVWLVTLCLLSEGCLSGLLCGRFQLLAECWEGLKFSIFPASSAVFYWFVVF